MTLVPFIAGGWVNDAGVPMSGWQYGRWAITSAKILALFIGGFRGGFRIGFRGGFRGGFTGNWEFRGGFICGFRGALEVI